MAENPDLAELQRLVKTFEDLDADLVGSNSRWEGDNPDDFWLHLEKTREAKMEIKELLASMGPLNVGRDLQQKLRKIRDNSGYRIDKIYGLLSLVLHEPQSQEEEDISVSDAILEEGSYVDHNFIRRRNQVGTTITTHSLPATFAQHLDKLKECYALGLFEATVIYCRAVIESGAFEALRSRGLIRTGQNLQDIREFKLKFAMDDVRTLPGQPGRPLVSRNTFEGAKTVIKHADSILHSKNQRIGVAENDAYRYIKNTFQFVEELFP